MTLDIKFQEEKPIEITFSDIQVFDNYDKGYKEGYDKGVVESYDEGYEQGETDGYANAVGKLEELTITKNGEYTPSEGNIGFSKVSADVGFVIPPFTGDLSYQFQLNKWNWFVEDYGNKIVTQDVTKCAGMFYDDTRLKSIPFEINCKEGSDIAMNSMFYNCKKLEIIPKINNCSPSDLQSIFSNCENIRNFPNDIESWFNWEDIDNGKSCYMNSMFRNCYSLRSLPMGLLKHGNPTTSPYQSIYYNGFESCYPLDEIVDLPYPYNATWTGNAFSSTFSGCLRLKNLTFETLNGKPLIVNWKSQLINLTQCGLVTKETYITSYNSGITSKTLIDSKESYQILKDNPDSWTMSYGWARYNHDSAVETINSLPDTSEYLALQGGTNTIKFTGKNGSLTDGGAINTLTEEEIAVATAKGWTVTFA